MLYANLFWNFAIVSIVQSVCHSQLEQVISMAKVVESEWLRVVRIGVMSFPATLFCPLRIFSWRVSVIYRPLPPQPLGGTHNLWLCFSERVWLGKTTRLPDQKHSAHPGLKIAHGCPLGTRKEGRGTHIGHGVVLSSRLSTCISFYWEERVFLSPRGRVLIIKRDVHCTSGCRVPSMLRKQQIL